MCALWLDHSNGSDFTKALQEEVAFVAEADVQLRGVGCGEMRKLEGQGSQSSIYNLQYDTRWFIHNMIMLEMETILPGL